MLFALAGAFREYIWSRPGERDPSRFAAAAFVTAEGTVEEIRVVSGHPLLLDAAIDAVKQWRYQPTYLNGEPVPVIFNATVNFQLASGS